MLGGNWWGKISSTYPQKLVWRASKWQGYLQRNELPTRIPAHHGHRHCHDHGHRHHHGLGHRHHPPILRSWFSEPPNDKVISSGENCEQGSQPTDGKHWTIVTAETDFHLGGDWMGWDGLGRDGMRVTLVHGQERDPPLQIVFGPSKPCDPTR